MVWAHFAREGAELWPDATHVRNDLIQSVKS